MPAAQRETAASPGSMLSGAVSQPISSPAREAAGSSQAKSARGGKPWLSRYA